MPSGFPVERASSAALLAALLAGTLVLAGCETRQADRPATAGGTVSGAAAKNQQEDSSAAAIRRFHSPLRQGPSGR